MLSLDGVVDCEEGCGHPHHPDGGGWVLGGGPAGSHTLPMPYPPNGPPSGHLTFFKFIRAHSVKASFDGCANDKTIPAINTRLSAVMIANSIVAGQGEAGIYMISRKKA